MSYTKSYKRTLSFRVLKQIPCPSPKVPHWLNYIDIIFDKFLKQIQNELENSAFSSVSVGEVGLLRYTQKRQVVLLSGIQRFHTPSWDRCKTRVFSASGESAITEILCNAANGSCLMDQWILHWIEAPSTRYIYVRSKKIEAVLNSRKYEIGWSFIYVIYLSAKLLNIFNNFWKD